MKRDTRHEKDPRRDERRLGTEIQDANILVWLPSPMGDAILCTPALRAIRKHFESSKIWFFANAVAREILSPCTFNDEWLEQEDKNPLATARKLKEYKFTHAILFKNSFASALSASLARIPSRIGYARQGRGCLLTDKLYPPKLPDGRYKPLSMIDYYLAIASFLGCDTADRKLHLLVNSQDEQRLCGKLPQILNPDNPTVIIVPGGAFGPSKCWPSIRYAQTADRLITSFNATVVVSVAPEPAEKQIAEEICTSTRLSLRAQQSNLKNKLINLAETPVSPGELKALFSLADLVISNDTGPRHIAIALRRKVVSLFGPNDPAWTDTEYENEIQIIGNVPCAPCSKPTCKESQHFCMQAITVEMVCDAAKELLEDSRKQATIMAQQEFVETSKSFLIDLRYRNALAKIGLTSTNAVFSFSAAKNLAKNNLAPFRSRLQFEIDSPGSPRPATVFLKRYDCPPVLVQLRNWLSARSRKSCSYLEFASANKLTAAGIGTPKTVSCGEQWGVLFEKRSFIITEEIPDAESLERKLPDCFNEQATGENLKLRRNFIRQLASFIKKFHETNYCHRDLYFSHIFYGGNGRFFLIDLARAFRPIVLRRRFQIKDVAQVYYSAPAQHFSKTDRLRFYVGYTGQSKLASKDKVLIRKVITRAKRMARHDVKHGRQVPFAG